MSALLLRLAGPLQSWGDHSTFAERDTGRYPTRSALIGLIASARGQRRTDSIEDLAPLRFTIRVDRPGQHLVDFHTVGGGLPREQTVPTSEGQRRSAGMGTIVSRRVYLADAAFVVAVHGPDQLITHVAAALIRPMWAPYLGRRSCPADVPLLVAVGEFDAEAHLHTAVPVARPRRRARLPVTFIYEEAPASEQNTHRVELTDTPISFDPAGRTYAGRCVHVCDMALPEHLTAGIGITYLDALHRYQQEVGS